VALVYSYFISTQYKKCFETYEKLIELGFEVNDFANYILTCCAENKGDQSLAKMFYNKISTEFIDTLKSPAKEYLRILRHLKSFKKKGNLSKEPEHLQLASSVLCYSFPKREILRSIRALERDCRLCNREAENLKDYEFIRNLI
jgi:hypothetical protein